MVTDDHGSIFGKPRRVTMGVQGTWSARALAACAAAGIAGCSSFQDPDLVVDLRVLAMTSSLPDQVIDVDLTQPVMPQSLLAQLVPTQVCSLVADPGLDRRLAWSLALCPLVRGDRCDPDLDVPLGQGLLDDPDTAVPEPQLCATVAPDGNLLAS
jgi:hypothetical protein